MLAGAEQLKNSIFEALKFFLAFLLSILLPVRLFEAAHRHEPTSKTIESPEDWLLPVFRQLFDRYVRSDDARIKAYYLLFLCARFLLETH